jgi:hypothetical protein
LDGPLPKLCQAVALSRQDGRHSAVALLLKAALIQVSDLLKKKPKQNIKQSKNIRISLLKFNNLKKKN